MGSKSFVSFGFLLVASLGLFAFLPQAQAEVQAIRGHALNPLVRPSPQPAPRTIPAPQLLEDPYLGFKPEVNPLKRAQVPKDAGYNDHIERVNRQSNEEVQARRYYYQNYVR